jgi:hypothetical protein
MLSTLTMRSMRWYRAFTSVVRSQGRPQRIATNGGVLAPRACPVLHLEGFTDLPVMQPGLGFYLELFRRRQAFAFVKRTHGFWDGLGFLCKTVPQLEARVMAGEPVTAAMVREALGDSRVVEAVDLRADRGYVDFFHDQFCTELVEDLQAPLAMNSYIEATAFRGYPSLDTDPAFHPVDYLRRVHHSFHLTRRVAHDALVWKQAIIDGTFWKVIEAFRDMPVVLVGPPHLSTIGRHLGLRDFHYVAIPLSSAHAHRRSILPRCKEAVERLSAGGRPGIVLYQAGTLAFWLIYRLFPLAPSFFHLDVGRALDVWYPEVVDVQPWFVQNGDRIVANMELGHLHRRAS